MDDMDKRYLLTLRQHSARYKRWIMLACILLMTAKAFVSEGRVFLRWGAAGNLARLVTAIGGKQAYSTTLTVNGHNASIAVYGLPDTNRSWINSVRSISYNRDNQRTTLTGLNLSDASLLFQYQRQLTTQSTQRSLSTLPIFPQSEQVFYAHDKEADMQISISSSRAAPEQVRDYYRATMKADGWHIPAISSAARPEGMSMFIKEQEVACVAIERLPDTHETRITLLHKKLRIK